MIAGPLCLGGKVGNSEEAIGSRETVFTFLLSPAEVPGSAEAETASRRHDKFCAIFSGQDKVCQSQCGKTYG